LPQAACAGPRDGRRIEGGFDDREVLQVGRQAFSGQGLFEEREIVGGPAKHFGRVLGAAVEVDIQVGANGRVVERRDDADSRREPFPDDFFLLIQPRSGISRMGHGQGRQQADPDAQGDKCGKGARSVHRI
jgi:hypothetical protein